MKKLAILLVVGFFRYSPLLHADDSTTVTVPSIPLSVPDAMISTKSLSALPKDIISIPLFKELLTEDFVFYYQAVDEDILTLKGALQRIAYEYQQTVLDHILKFVFDSPAELSLWKTSDGKLRDLVVVMENSGLKMFLEAVAKLALADSQFGFERKIKINGKDETDVFHLKAGRQTYYIATLKGKVYLFTNLERTLLVSDPDAGAVEKIKTFFGFSELKTGYLGLFGVKRGEEKHDLLVSMKYLSGGYQRFFSTLKAMRFVMTNGRWETHLLSGKPNTASAAADLAQLKNSKTPSEYWKIVPKNAGLCVTIPMDQSTILEFGKTTLASIPQATDLLRRFSMSSVVCWLATSKPFAPVFIVNAQLKESDRPVIKKLFEYLIDPKINDKFSEADRLRLKNISENSQGNTYTLMREVVSRYGLVQKKTGGPNYFNVKLALKNNLLVFSPEAAAVDQVLLTIDKKYPSLHEILGPISKEAPLYISPDKLSQVVMNAILDTLPASQEGVFRNAVTKHLFPNLKKMARQPAFTLSFPIQSAGQSVWTKIFWNTNAGK